MLFVVAWNPVGKGVLFFFFLFHRLYIALAYCVGKQGTWKESRTFICHDSCQSATKEKTCMHYVVGWHENTHCYGTSFAVDRQGGFCVMLYLVLCCIPVGDRGTFLVKNVFYSILVVQCSLLECPSSTPCNRAHSSRIATVTFLMLPSFSVVIHFFSSCFPLGHISSLPPLPQYPRDYLPAGGFAPDSTISLMKVSCSRKPIRLTTRTVKIRGR